MTPCTLAAELSEGFRREVDKVGKLIVEPAT